MAECSDKHIRSLLHSYELGLLAEDERRQLEMHLMDCPSCRKEVIDFQDTMLLLRQDKEVRGLIQSLDGEEKADNGETREAGRKKRRWLPTLIPASVLALAVLFLLVLKPWQIEISPTQEAIAAGNRLAIMYFDNIAEPEDPQRLGEILTNLLITDLAESRYIQVVSHQHLFDILKLLDLENTKRINGETATRVAEKARARWMLMGSILQVQPQLVITAQLVEVESGNIIASQRVSGQINENIFSLVDKLSAEIKNDMALPAEASDEVDRPVADVTTHSPEAYRLYYEGVEDYYKFYMDDAAAKFEKALEYDSTFAMAYYYLAIIKHSKLIDKAVEYSEKASQKEQLYIKSRDALIKGNAQKAIDILKKMIVRFPDEKLAYFVLGTLFYSGREYQLSIEAEKKALEIDPMYTAAMNQLAYSYNSSGDVESALKVISTYTMMLPDDANPYDSRGDILSRNGRYAEAVESYKMALQKKPDFINSISQLCLLNIILKNYADAEKYADLYMSTVDSTERFWAMMYPIYVVQYQGRFNETLGLLDKTIAAIKKETGEEKYLGFRHLKAVIYGEQGRWDQAREEMAKCVENDRPTGGGKSSGFMDLYAQILAESGQIDRAAQVAESLKTLIEKNPNLESDYLYAMGAIELVRGNTAGAIDYLKAADQKIGMFSYSIHFMLGRAYQEANMPEEALMEFNSVLAEVGYYHFYWGVWTVKTYYYRGLVFEQLGATDKAIADYTRFLDIWENADPGIKAMDDARARLTQLKTKS